MLGLVAAGGALASTALHNDLFALIAAGGVVAALVAGKLFGNAELRLIHKRIAAAMRHVWPGRGGNRPWELTIRLQGKRGLGPGLGGPDGRGGSTESPDDRSGCQCPGHARELPRSVGPAGWPVRRVPVAAGDTAVRNGIPIGRLSVSAERDDQSIADALEVLVKMVEMAEIRATEGVTVPVAASPAKSAVAEPVVPARV